MPDNDWLGKIKGHVSEAKRRASTDKREREAAEKSPQSIILTKREVQGEWDANRVLTTTLGGGKPRPITANDLAQFRHNMRIAQQNFKGEGITAKQVIDLASARPLTHPLVGAEKGSDIDRARKQITMAVPVSARNNEVRFITNAGPDSKVLRHNVLIRFNAFTEAANKLVSIKVRDRKNPKQTANWLRKQKLAFDCDCERHRYFFRYISTIGNFNAGRKEMGFPKIRNPKLMGVACKHVLRVMAEVDTSGVVLNFLTKHMEKVHASADNTARHQANQSDFEETVNQQSSRKTRRIKTSTQRANDRRSAKARSALHNVAKVAPRLNVKPSATRRIEHAIKTGKIEESDLAVLRKFNFSDEQIAQKITGG